MKLADKMDFCSSIVSVDLKLATPQFAHYEE